MAEHQNKASLPAGSQSSFLASMMEIERGGKVDDVHQMEEEEVDDEERLEDLAIYRLDYEVKEEQQQGEYQKCLDDDDDDAAEFRAARILQPRAAGGEILEPGDHCYMWCTLYQHHAIVLETYPAAAESPTRGPLDSSPDCTPTATATAVTTTSTAKTSDASSSDAAAVDARIPEKTPEQTQCKYSNNSCCNDIDEIDEQDELQPGRGTSVAAGAGGSILIAEFTNLALAEDLAAVGGVLAAGNNKSSSSLLASASTAAGATSGGGVQGGFRIVLETDPHLKWHKVKYQAHPVFECLTWRPGTCSSATRLPTREILMRVHFLYEWGHSLIPDYHLVFSNCETVAVWCVTGQWMTLQGDGALRMSTLGTAAAAAAAVTTMAMAPVGLALAATSGGLALWRSMRLQKQCHDTAAMLNRQYEWYSLGRTPSTFPFQPTA